MNQVRIIQRQKPKIVPGDGITDRKKRAEIFLDVQNRQVHKISWFVRILLTFMPYKQIIHPDKRIYNYEELSGKVYHLEYTGYKSIDSASEYHRLFGKEVKE